jgi:hypothetical protein
LDGNIREWINKVLSKNILEASEINWTLGNTVMSVSSKEIEGRLPVWSKHFVSVLDYRLDTKETQVFWKNLFATMKINTSGTVDESKEIKQKPHNLLLNGPVDYYFIKMS